MEREIKVSVIIPVYNVETYISKCISSVIEQNYKNIEIILIDDGSQDSSGKILDDVFVDRNPSEKIKKIKAFLLQEIGDWSWHQETMWFLLMGMIGLIMTMFHILLSCFKIMSAKSA